MFGSIPADSGEVLLKMARLEKKIERILENQHTLLRGAHGGGMPDSLLPQERFHMTDGSGKLNLDWLEVSKDFWLTVALHYIMYHDLQSVIQMCLDLEI